MHRVLPIAKTGIDQLRRQARDKEEGATRICALTGAKTGAPLGANSGGYAQLHAQPLL